jgi:hypothetical protein
MLKSKSEELAKKLGHNKFKATDGWLSQWKCMFGIKFMKTHGKKDSADVVSAEQWKSTNLPNLLQKFCTDDIHNANETGLFYHAIADGSLSYKHRTLSGSKKATVSVTVLCCSNMSGTDEEKLLVTGTRGLNALKGLVWTVYQFYTMLTKMHGRNLKFLKNGQ